MKLAMFGGSFDPVHNDHIGLCNKMLQSLSLDKVVVFPAACSPFKDDTQTDALHRFNMCNLAFEAYDNVDVSDFEIKRGGKSYTVDTLKFLSEKYKGAEIFLITGADAFLTLSSWYKASEIFSLAHILTVVRDNDNIDVLKAKAKEYEAYNAKCTLINTPVGNLSSTKVRSALKNREDVRDFLPQSVIDYIIENGLYGYGNY
ncbi:MAG: nicotinate (nicotinamide) nucleotide adenylyltransferase [Ruminococcus sp.]|nr:nicotinate (nicotinamide) nucleotide adenylyltransferase [Ruminococcus sp.]